MKECSVINLEQNENAKNKRCYISHMYFSVAKTLIKMFLINISLLPKLNLLQKRKAQKACFECIY